MAFSFHTGRKVIGFGMMIRPLRGLRIVNKAQEERYAAIAREGWAQGTIDHMQTRSELRSTILLHDDEALGAVIVQSIIATDMPQKT